MYLLGSVGFCVILIVDSMIGRLGSTTGQTSRLQAVSMVRPLLTRHGDRAPVQSYPLDPYKDFPWPGGYGALSPRGARQMYESGLIKARRYSSLLTQVCQLRNLNSNFKTIYVRSSAVERCVASAVNFLAGFFPLPFPQSLINIKPLEQDEMLGMANSCFSKINSTDKPNSTLQPGFDWQSEEGKERMAYIRKNTGINATSVADLFGLADTLSVQRDNGFELPAWVDHIFDEYLQSAMLMAMDAFGTSAILTTRSGTLLKDMITRLENFIKGFSSENILFYSGHDINILGMLYFLEIRNQIPGLPAYGSMLSMELYQNYVIPDDYEIKIVYFAHYGDVNPMNMIIPRCSTPCAFRKFKRTVESKFVVDAKNTC